MRPLTSVICRRSALPTALLAAAVAACGSSSSSGAPIDGAPVVLPDGRIIDTLPQPFDVGVAYPRTVHVAPGGDDTTGDGSASAPYRTIGRGIDDATPGTQVLVAAGSYPPMGSFAGLQGEAGAPIAITGQGNVVIDGGGAEMGIGLSDPRYLVIEGLTIQNAFPHGMNIDDGGSYATPAQHLVLRRLTITNVGNGGNSDCIKLSGVDDFFVLDSDVSDCNNGELIDMVGCHRGFIHGNDFHDAPINGVQTKGGSSDTVIHGNRFAAIAERSVNAGGSTGADYYRPADAAYEANHISIIGNIFEGSGSAPVAFVGCQACVFANNTVIDPRGNVARILEENTALGPGGDGYFINNLIVFNTASLNDFSYVNVGAGTRPESFVFGWNLWYALDDPGFAGPPYAGVPDEMSAVVQQDPALLDRVGGDYHLTNGSPAIGRGRDVPGGLPADFDGRAYGSPPAIGAFTGP